MLEREVVVYRDNRLEEVRAGYIYVEERKGGVYVEIPRNTELKRPIVLSFCMRDEKVQEVRNEIVAGKGSCAELLISCSSCVENSIHKSLNKFTLEDFSRLKIKILHSFSQSSAVKSTSLVRIGRSACLNYSFKQVASPASAELISAFSCGESSSLSYRSFIKATKCARVLERCACVLRDYSSSSILSRVASLDTSNVRAILKLVGAGKKVRGHVECTGIIVDSGRISSSPELVALSSDAELTHEASIGRIKEDEIFYLMTRGYSREEAINLLVSSMMEV